MKELTGVIILRDSGNDRNWSTHRKVSDRLVGKRRTHADHTREPVQLDSIRTTLFTSEYIPTHSIHPRA
jgi:hypothetical protein